MTVPTNDSVDLVKGQTPSSITLKEPGSENVLDQIQIDAVVGNVTDAGDLGNLEVRVSEHAGWFVAASLQRNGGQLSQGNSGTLVINESVNNVSPFSYPFVRTALSTSGLSAGGESTVYFAISS